MSLAAAWTCCAGGQTGAVGLDGFNVAKLGTALAGNVQDSVPGHVGRGVANDSDGAREKRQELSL